MQYHHQYCYRRLHHNFRYHHYQYHQFHFRESNNTVVYAMDHKDNQFVFVR